MGFDFLKKFRNVLINRLIYFSPSFVLRSRHYFNNRNAIRKWIADDPFLLHVPKTGGTSIAKSLGRVEPGHFDFKHLLKMYPELNEREAFYFISRNPVERIISTYNYINDLHEKFGTSNIPSAFYANSADDFVVNYLDSMNIDDHYFLRSVETIIKGAPLKKVFALCFDDLEKNIGDFLVLNNKPKIELLHENKSSTAVDENVLGVKALEIIKKKYKYDFFVYEKAKEKGFFCLDQLNELG